MPLWMYLDFAAVRISYKFNAQSNLPSSSKLSCDFSHMFLLCIIILCLWYLFSGAAVRRDAGIGGGDVFCYPSYVQDIMG